MYNTASFLDSRAHTQHMTFHRPVIMLSLFCLGSLHWQSSKHFRDRNIDTKRLELDDGSLCKFKTRARGFETLHALCVIDLFLSVKSRTCQRFPERSYCIRKHNRAKRFRNDAAHPHVHLMHLVLAHRYHFNRLLSLLWTGLVKLCTYIPDIVIIQFISHCIERRQE